jgi:DNA recombination protein RmuC
VLKEQDSARRGQIDAVRALLDEKLAAFVSGLDRNKDIVERALREIGEKVADHNIRALQEQKDQAERITRRLQEQTESVGANLKSTQATIEKKLQDIQGGNEKKLEEMRQTVDQKLTSTLEQRIGESFKQVVVNLESVQRGLGEMRNLAKGVGDLNRVFSNVKTRGVFGEVQLRAILEEMLRPDQFVVNYKPRLDSGEAVEFAIKIPRSKRSDGGYTYIPLDAKFPREDYERLQLASEAGDVAGMEMARKALITRIEGCAKDICEKYIAPPETTNFGIMFLATEGLYAEALREPGFQEKLQREYRVIIAGPTTLSAILSSLSVGFQTADIERRSSEIQMVLSAVKTEFGKFGEALRLVRKQLGTASKSLDKTFARTRKMEGALDGIAAMPADKTTRVFEVLGSALDTHDMDLVPYADDEPEPDELDESMASS